MGLLGKRKLVKDISANMVQTIITQVFTFIIFYFTSRYLSKNDFGEFNWSMAIGSTFIAVASLGLDLVFVKRMAQGKDIITVSGIHFFHTIIVGITVCLLSFVLKISFPALDHNHPLLFLVFLSLSVANIANSFKLGLNGLEEYKKLATLAVCSNIFKLSWVVALYLSSYFTIVNIIFSYISTSLLEFIVGYFMINKSLSSRIKPVLKVEEYKYFILESLPQLGVVLFDSALARIDWILLGVISTAAVTAEYSFAYKIFELSKMPLLIIAPVLLTRFAKLFDNSKGEISDERKNEINLLLKLETFIIMFIPIALASIWSPLIDYFTNNKYGAVNEINYIILAACVPLHALINFLWTIGFVQGQLKTIMFITITVSVFNIIANLIFIPLYSSLGASITFLISTIIQLSLYLKFINQSQIKLKLKNILPAFIFAITAIAISKLFAHHIIMTPIFALCTYVFLMLTTKAINIKQIKQSSLFNKN